MVVVVGDEGGKKKSKHPSPGTTQRLTSIRDNKEQERPNIVKCNIIRINNICV